MRQVVRRPPAGKLIGVESMRDDKRDPGMNLIGKLLPSANVVLDLEVASKKRVFEQVGLLFENSSHVARARVFDALFAREKLGSTGLGQGVAIPHGRIKGLKDPLGAVVRTRQPVPFDAPDGQPVGLIFVLLVPDRATDAHLQLLSELAQMFSNRAFRERLLAAPTAAELHRLITHWEPHASGQRSQVV
jgi:PTS system nitrogen regulatory IIA component